jgi:D-alanine-D-alanine ligase
MALGCRDVARIDFRMDDKGRLYFIECNPLPGLTPGWSDLVLIAQGAGMDYRGLIGEIMAPAIRRYKEREARRAADESALTKPAMEKSSLEKAPLAEEKATPINGSGSSSSSSEPPARMEMKS